MKNLQSIKMIYKLSDNKRRILFEEDNKQSWIILDLKDSKDYCLFQSYNKRFNEQ